MASLTFKTFQGYAQQYVINYEEAFAPIAKMTIVHDFSSHL